MNEVIVRVQIEAVDCKGEAGAAEISRHCGIVACFLNLGISKFTLRDTTGEVGHFSIVLE